MEEEIGYTIKDKMVCEYGSVPTYFIPIVNCSLPRSLERIWSSKEDYRRTYRRSSRQFC